MLPLAPALFSTMTGWPVLVASFSPIERAIESTIPPAVKGTMILIVLLGKTSCAEAGAAAIASAPVAAAMKVRRNRVMLVSWISKRFG